MDSLAGHLDLTQTFQVSGGGITAQPATSGTSIITQPIQKAYEKMKAATKR
jgi:hypothetical protein